MPIDSIIRANRAGGGGGIVSICSAHPQVLRAALQHGLEDGGEVLIEATCNQVNQDGGYTGMTPADFAAQVLGEARRVGFPAERVNLGGDHLGPNPWRSLPASEAMARAETMVAAYARAGFTKLHLDASMSCADDPAVLNDDQVAERAARLCAAAEAAIESTTDRAASNERGAAALRYVIGTEVPTPGGAHEAIDSLTPTSTQALQATLAAFEAAFDCAGLQAAWTRAIAVVVQPGVEFGHADVLDYRRAAAAPLAAFADRLPRGMAFEAHSTDYQRERALGELVDDHFAILKVGPELTFALREALFALDMMDRERLPKAHRAGLADALERAMVDDPRHWQDYYTGTETEQGFARRFSLSDRSRYYWSAPSVMAAEARLIDNFVANPPPLTLIGQYLPAAVDAVRDGTLEALQGEATTAAGAYPPLCAPALVRQRVRKVIARYARACAAA